MTRSSTTTSALTSATIVSPAVLRVVATLSVLFIVAQGASAGGILSRVRVAEALHYDGAIVVHVLTGLTALAAVLITRQRRSHRWPAALAVVIFVLGFVQAAIGDAGILVVHVPLAMLLLVGAVFVMGWSFVGMRH